MTTKTKFQNKKSTKKIQKRDPQKTRAKILDCATECFATSGYEGTSLKNILDKAKVNKRMVYHYYGSKESLYRAVHTQQWKLLSEWFTQSLLSTQLDTKSDHSAKTLLMKSAEIFHDFCANHQTFLRLILWDGLEGGAVSRSIWEDVRGPLYQQFVHLFQGARSQGIELDELSPDHVIVTFMGAILFYFAYSNSLSDIFGQDPLEEKAVQKRKEQVLKQLSKILV
ncbi:MAG: TetR/AcrR family transcriptional regulator [Deltaproteobacteria bacterium]|nr:TetR/AcrR family transcriptional regulator [Deltaproteobacteria bacterium]